jgi:hypothetical protein
VSYAPPNAGTEYGSTGLAVESPGPEIVYTPAQTFPPVPAHFNTEGPEGPYKSALMQDSGGWWEGRALAIPIADGVRLAAKYELPGKDWSYFVFADLLITSSGEEMDPTFVGKEDKGLSFVVFNDGAFSTEKRELNLFGEWSYNRHFNIALAERSLSGLPDAAIPADVPAPRFVSIRGALSGLVAHDLSRGALDGSYDLADMPGSQMTIATDTNASYSLTGTVLPEANVSCDVDGDLQTHGTSNVFSASFRLLNCGADFAGWYQGVGARMFEAAKDQDPNALVIYARRRYDADGLTGQILEDNPVELALVPQVRIVK